MDPSVLATQAVGGFTVGALVGYAIRKVTKWILIGIGILLLPIVGLWHFGILYVDWNALNQAVGNFINWLGVNLSDASSAFASAGALGVSGLVGVAFGISGGLLRGTILPLEGEKNFVRRKE